MAVVWYCKWWPGVDTVYEPGGEKTGLKNFKASVRIQELCANIIMLVAHYGSSVTEIQI